MKSVFITLSSFLVVSLAPQLSWGAKEAEQMAIEYSNKLLPPPKLLSQMTEQLKAIRDLYPEVSDVTHRPKWAAGELYVSGITPQMVRTLNQSEYGPLKSAEKISSSFPVSYKLVFARPYHPAKLAEKLNEDFDIRDAEANIITGDGNNIDYHVTAPTYVTYKFTKGWDSCEGPTGCISKHYWEFTVAPSRETLTVKLEKDYGSPLPQDSKA